MIGLAGAAQSTLAQNAADVAGSGVELDQCAVAVALGDDIALLVSLDTKPSLLFHKPFGNSVKDYLFVGLCENLMVMRRFPAF